MDLLNQLNRAMAYIEANITDDDSLSRVAGVTSYSPYHFQRIFNYISDMPLSEYIRRRKLSLAAEQLQSGGGKVIDLAVKYGYDSADSFTRAFAKQHGMTPTSARGSGANLHIYLPLTFQIQIKGVRKMNWRIEEKEAFRVFGIERIFKNDETDKVPAFWDECHRNGEYERLFRAAGGIKVKEGPCVINAVCGYCEPGENTFPYMLFAMLKDGCDINGFKTAEVPRTLWAIFRSELSDTIGKQIPELFKRAYSEWLPSSGYDKAAGPDMEIYGSAANGKYYEEVWLPVKKKADE